MVVKSQKKPLKIMMLSLHGLIRNHNLELGKDPDTGGQIKYVLELVRELDRSDEVASVELLTRQIIDERVSSDYAQIEEAIGTKSKIVRLPFGPQRYLRKEALWPFMEIFIDQAIGHIRRTGLPDVIHGHYADAGYAGAQLARLLHIPYVFTGHSLGRVKHIRLMKSDQQPDAETLEETYRFSTRNEAEEMALETASMVITSTNQEVLEQYELYEHYQPDRMEVIPPGVDLDSFYPPAESMRNPCFVEQLKPFLTDLSKPTILAIARLDERKNFETLVRVYGKSVELQRLANLVLILGTRTDSRKLPHAQRRVFANLLSLIDYFNLYGKVAYPKSHSPNDIPELFRWAAMHRGVFINPALTEPFGLTLLEAAASGLPIVATNDGGPNDIIGNCQNGLLVDPLDESSMEHALVRVLSESDQWRTWSNNGMKGVAEHYSWSMHVKRYLRDIHEIVQASEQPAIADRRTPRRLPDFNRMIVADLDNTLQGDDEALNEFVDLLQDRGRHIGFAIATGRRLDDVMSWLEERNLPHPDVIAAAVGTELYYGKGLTLDESWRKQLSTHWKPAEVRKVLDEIPGIEPQPEREQSKYKVSYRIVEPNNRNTAGHIRRRLREVNLRVKVIQSLGSFLDVLPLRGGSDLSIRHLAYRWGFAPEQILVAGDSGNDEGMLKGGTLGVVVGNYSPELEKLRNFPRIYFAQGCHARGILEGIEYYNFLGHIRIPNDATIESEEEAEV